MSDKVNYRKASLLKNFVFHCDFAGGIYRIHPALPVPGPHPSHPVVQARRQHVQLLLLPLRHRLPPRVGSHLRPLRHVLAGAHHVCHDALFGADWRGHVYLW